MKKKMSFQLLSLYSPLLIAVSFSCALLQTGCNNAGGQTNQQKSNNWITMDITFKPNTNEESRDKAIRAIEKMWIKSAAPIMKKYPNLYPSISVTKMPFLDTLKYRLRLLETYYSKTASGGYAPVTTAKIITPPCCSGPIPTCPCLCPACDSTMRMVSSTYNIAKMTFEK
jgi:hypothetical protein